MDNMEKKDLEKRYRIDFKRLFLVLGALLLCVLLLQSCIISCIRDTQTSTSDNEDALGVRANHAAQILACFAPAAPEGQAVTLCAPQPLLPELSIPTPPSIQVYYHKEDALRETDLESYLVGVLAGEMPVSFHEQALMAQAVAARTYTRYKAAHGGCGSKEDADVCTNSQCCQAYQSTEALQTSWGDAYEERIAKLQNAVAKTQGKIITYEGAPIEALYHSGSGGKTEDSELVFAAARPYLRMVESENEVGGRQENQKEISFADFAQTVNKSYPKAKLKSERSALLKSVRVLSLSDSGRVLQIQMGEISITGKQCRKLFSLDSTLFSIAFTEDAIVFSTKGFGHGVGMSQSGANGMAQAGSDWEEILLHYYTGVEIGDI